MKFNPTIKYAYFLSQIEHGILDLEITQSNVVIKLTLVIFRSLDLLFFQFVQEVTWSIGCSHLRPQLIGSVLFPLVFCTCVLKNQSNVLLFFCLLLFSWKLTANFVFTFTFSRDLYIFRFFDLNLFQSTYLFSLLSLFDNQSFSFWLWINVNVILRQFRNLNFGIPFILIILIILSLQL